MQTGLKQLFFFFQWYVRTYMFVPGHHIILVATLAAKTPVRLCCAVLVYSCMTHYLNALL